MESAKTRWEKLLEQASHTSNSMALHEGNERLLSLVTLLQKEGAGLVAEGVEMPVPPPPKDPPVQSLGIRAWFKSTAQDRYEPLVLASADDEDDGVSRLS
jgi:hypothetical protein